MEPLRTSPLGSDRRRQRVLAMLEQCPKASRAVVVDDGAEADVILALAIRVPMPGGKRIVTFEMNLPRAKYDGMLLLDLIQRCCAGEH